MSLFFSNAVGDQFGSSLIENATEVARIPAKHTRSPSYFHSFGMSKNYVIFIEQPFLLDDDQVKGGCIYESSSSQDKLPIERPNRQSFAWKRGEMVKIISSIYILDLQDIVCR